MKRTTKVAYLVKEIEVALPVVRRLSRILHTNIVPQDVESSALKAQAQQLLRRAERDIEEALLYTRDIK